MRMPQTDDYEAQFQEADSDPGDEPYDLWRDLSEADESEYAAIDNPSGSRTMNRALVISQQLTLQSLSDIQVAALNNALSFGEGRPVSRENVAFHRAVELTLIKPNGLAEDYEELVEALSQEVLRRPAFASHIPPRKG
jgi:hypothetical protein